MVVLHQGTLGLERWILSIRQCQRQPSISTYHVVLDSDATACGRQPDGAEKPAKSLHRGVVGDRVSPELDLVHVVEVDSEPEEEGVPGGGRRIVGDRVVDDAHVLTYSDDQCPAELERPIG